MPARNLGSLKAAVKTATDAMAPTWIWTWGGKCFGYREGDSLFTYEGKEAGRFVGAEIYGVDGRYIGEVRNAEDGQRLITSLYKKSRIIGGGFYPAHHHTFSKPADRREEQLYTGYEDFPAPQVTKKSVAKSA